MPGLSYSPEFIFKVVRMIPFQKLLAIDKDASVPLYLQISKGFIRLIKEGSLKRNSKIPGSRLLSVTLDVHRKTVVAAYEELQLQGWIYTEASKGSYVSETIPEITPKAYHPLQSVKKKKAGFEFKQSEVLHSNVYKASTLLEINDGMPDIRLAPMDSLARAIRSVLKGERGKQSLSYNDIEGSIHLRTELCSYLNESRSFDFTSDNIFITRGTIMGLYLSLSVLLKKGDHVIVAETGYRSVNLTIQHLGGNLIKVPVDENGLNVEAIEKICKKKKIRAIYVTPHHHYPTTVTMSPDRRMGLLAVAEKYNIVILEDDYDYDYHFSHSPYLPLATYDPAGLVIYIGSFSKTFSPAFRVGYITAPENFIQEIAKLRRIIDRQGDSILEHAMAELFKGGEIKSHLKKSHSAYKERRNVFCEQLQHIAKDRMEFIIPEGGMAVWTAFDKKIPLPSLAKEAASKGLFISDGSSFGNNCTRLGYTSLSVEEIDIALTILSKSMDTVGRRKI
ncbi:MAG: PLP-dependent aminotransferase family protein [Cytophagales bacterium]|nr:PLP-dependent aminotransferase family protein [Cytophaga sp.]